MQRATWGSMATGTVLLLSFALSLLTAIPPVWAQPESLQRYVSEVEGKLQLKWNDFKGAKPGVQTPHVRFTVMPDGHIENAHISKTSTSQNVDDAAVACVKDAAPFERLPADAPKDGIDIDMGLHINFIGAGDDKSAEESEGIIKAARDLLATGNWQSAESLLKNYLVNHPQDQPVKTKLIDLYLNRSELLKAKDPNAAASYFNKAKALQQ